MRNKVIMYVGLSFFFLGYAMRSDDALIRLYHAILTDDNTHEVEKILKNNAHLPVNMPNYKGDTTMHLLVERVRYSEKLFPVTQHMLELLKNYGGDVNVQDSAGQTPLHRAASYGSASMVACLLHHNAAINTPDSAGQTALMKAAFLRHAHVVEVLLRNCADIFCKDMNKKNVFEQNMYDSFPDTKSVYQPALKMVQENKRKRTRIDDLLEKRRARAGFIQMLLARHYYKDHYLAGVPLDMMKEIYAYII